MALKMPNRYRLPPDLEEAALVAELGFPPQVIEEWPERFIEAMLIYRGVKNVAIYGGNWQP